MDSGGETKRSDADGKDVAERWQVAVQPLDNITGDCINGCSSIDEVSVRKDAMRKYIGCCMLLVCLLLSACAHGPIEALPKVIDIESCAEAVIIRNKNFVGATNSYIITLDNSDILGIRIGEYTKFNLEPGKHSIGVKCFGGWSPTWKENKKEWSFAAKAKYYFLVSPDASCAEIEQITEQDAAKRISESTYLPIQ